MVAQDHTLLQTLLEMYQNMLPGGTAVQLLPQFLDQVEARATELLHELDLVESYLKRPFTTMDEIYAVTVDEFSLKSTREYALELSFLVAHRDEVLKQIPTMRKQLEQLLGEDK